MIKLAIDFENPSKEWWENGGRDLWDSITEGFVVKPSELELTNPAMQLGDTPTATREIWAGLPPLYWMIEMPGLKPGARVLAHHPTSMDHQGRPLPLVCLQYVGAGKVLMHATDETWRWRRRVGDAHFARYWVQMIRYLSRSKLVGEGDTATLSTNRADYTLGESVRLRARFADDRLAPDADDGVVVMVQQRGGKTYRTVLRRVTLPMIGPSLAAGLALTWARALGEFGATITFAGNLQGRTQTLPLAVFVALESDRGAAVALSLVMVVISLTVLVVLRERWWRAL